jgi:tRNA pseudouridine32 synthase/23S rRNA pseudouridine746 synthase
VKIFPKTGRTHQIRVHSLAINHSVVNDTIYEPANLHTINTNIFNRMMLHALSLSFYDKLAAQDVIIKSDIPRLFTKRYTK